MREKEKESTRVVSDSLTVRVCNRDYSVRAIPNVKAGERVVVRFMKDGAESGVCVDKYDDDENCWRVFPAPVVERSLP